MGTASRTDLKMEILYEGVRAEEMEQKSVAS